MTAESAPTANRTAPHKLSDSGARRATVSRTAPASDFAHVDTWIFDLDNTLYPSSCNLFAEVDQRMGSFIAKTIGVPYAHARHLQKAYYRQFGTTLAGLMKIHKLQPEPFLAYVHDIDLSVLPEDPALASAIAALPGRRLIFTNGSKRHAENVANKIGILHLFDGITDIASSNFIPKPDAAAFDAMVKAHDLDPTTSAMFEDMPQNLEVPSALGMRTVLIRSDYMDHPAQRKIRNWTSLPSHIHHMTDRLTEFLTDDLTLPVEQKG